VPKKIIIYSITLILIFIISYAHTSNSGPIPASSRQMIAVITDSANASKGYLYRFERQSRHGTWMMIEEKIPVVIGRNGLGWGKGLHPSPSNSNLPVKKEGDGRSPAGIFKFSSVFGYLPLDQMGDLKMNYIHLTESSECVDDVKSAYYNLIVSREEVKDIDWLTSEKMRSAGIYYELGVVIDHNSDPIEPGAGSCIFLHNWLDPDETMAGCTGMDPAHMKEIVYWLVKKNNPVLIQLTRELYNAYKQEWRLPEIQNLYNLD